MTSSVSEKTINENAIKRRITMNEKKSVAKSIRLTPELFNFINEYDGNGFNEKFANIISFCFRSEKDVRARVKQERQELERLQKNIAEKRRLLSTLQRLEWQIDHATSIADELPTNDEDNPKKEKNLDGQEQFF